MIENTLQNISYVGSQPLLIVGGAGTGKSAIAGNIVHTLQDRKGASSIFSFFCKYDQPGRDNPQSIIPTLAWQLCEFPCYRVAIESQLACLKTMREDILRTSPARHIDLLTSVPKPDGTFSERPTLILDGLDKVKDEMARLQLIQAFMDSSSALCDRFRVVFAARPIPHVQVFIRPASKLVVDLDDSLDSEATLADLRTYFSVQLGIIASSRGMRDWPSDCSRKDDDCWGCQVCRLARDSGGLFVWARVAVRTIDCITPETALTHLLATGPDLDQLYTHAITVSLGRSPSEDHVKLVNVVVGVILYVDRQYLEDYFESRTLRIDVLADLCGRSENDVIGVLGVLEPLFVDRSSPNEVGSFLHRSVDEYFRGCHQYSVPKEEGEFQLARRCYQVLDRAFRTADKIGAHAAIYACVACHIHADRSGDLKKPDSLLALEAYRFLETSYLSALGLWTGTGQSTPLELIGTHDVICFVDFKCTVGVKLNNIVATRIV